MSAQKTSRAAILGRIRAAGCSASTILPHEYICRGTRDPDARLKLMRERLEEYGARVVESTPERLAACISGEIAAGGRRKLVAPSGLPSNWLTADAEWTVDRGLEIAEIEKMDGAMTTAFGGIADSGTIVLHHSASEGRRVLTLLPDWHLCVLYASQVVETLPEYFSRCPRPPALATYISGPSATADIEMTRIKGVHGPRFLTVILVRDEK